MKAERSPERPVGAKAHRDNLSRQDLSIVVQKLQSLVDRLEDIHASMVVNDFNYLWGSMRKQRDKALVTLKNFADDTEEAHQWEKAHKKVSG